MKDGTVKKQVMSITVRPFPAVEQENRQVILPLRVPEPEPQQCIDWSDEELVEIHEQLPRAHEQAQPPSNMPRKPDIRRYTPPAMRYCT